MTDSLFTGTPGLPDNSDGQAINTGTTFRVTAPVSCTHHRFYAPSNAPGTVTARLYELTSDTTATLLAEKVYGGAITLGAYNQQAWDTPVALVTGKAYRTQHHASADHYVATLSALTGDVTSGGGLLVACGDGATVDGFTVHNGKFTYNGTPTLAVTTSAGTNFFDDVVVVSSAATVEFAGALDLGGLVGAGLYVRSVDLSGALALGGISLSGSAQGSTVPDHGVVSDGSWYSLLNVLAETRAWQEAERTQCRIACECGEPLRSGPHGELYCAFDGRIYR